MRRSRAYPKLASVRAIRALSERAAGRTHIEIAAEMGVAPNTLNSILRGEPVAPKTIAKFGRWLNANPPDAELASVLEELA